ncbi:hypothetical protein ACWGIN_15410 [Streptomyces sp. NPDC054861]
MSAHDLPPRSLLVAFAATSVLAWLVSGRRRGPLAIGGGLLAVQSALHLVFSWSGAHPAAGRPDAHALSADHLSHGSMWGAPLGHPAMGDTPMGDGSMGHAPMGDPPTAGTTMGTALEMVAGHTSLGMVAAHLLAAVVCGLWLAHGEAALFALARAVGALAFTPLRMLLAVVPVPAPPRLRPARTRPHHHRLRGVVLAHTLSRRGPPRLSVPRATALGAHV